MKSVLLSIKPKYCALIANGRKTIEVRKTRPKLEVPFKCYIYCTKAKGWFKASESMALSNDELYRHPREGIKYGNSIELMCEDDYSADNFLNGKVIGEFACDKIERFSTFDNVVGQTITINDACRLSCLKIEDIQKYECNGLKQEGMNLIGLYGWHITDLKIYDKPKELREFTKTRPPQSWCYVWEDKSI